jgi:hypothetical protein
MPRMYRTGTAALGAPMASEALRGLIDRPVVMPDADAPEGLRVELWPAPNGPAPGSFADEA